jgi:hypothetical protein
MRARRETTTHRERARARKNERESVQMRRLFLRNIVLLSLLACIVVGDEGGEATVGTQATNFVGSNVLGGLVVLGVVLLSKQ